MPSSILTKMSCWGMMKTRKYKLSSSSSTSRGGLDMFEVVKFDWTWGGGRRSVERCLVGYRLAFFLFWYWYYWSGVKRLKISG